MEPNRSSLGMRRSLDGPRKSSSIADKHGLFNGARQSRVDEGTIEQTARRHRNHHSPELASLRFVDGDRVSEIDAIQGVFIESLHDAVEIAFDEVAGVASRRALRRDPANASQASIEQVAVVIVHQMDHRLALCDAPHGKRLVSGGEEFVKGPVERLRAGVATLPHTEDLHFAVNFKRPHHIDHCLPGVPARGLNQCHALGGTGEPVEPRRAVVRSSGRVSLMLATARYAKAAPAESP